MQNQSNEAPLTLVIVTPAAAPVRAVCDSVHLPLADDSHGSGGGAYGVRAGHVAAVLSLGDGMIEAFCAGKCLLQRRCTGGFAQVTDNTVTVMTEQ